MTDINRICHTAEEGRCGPSLGFDAAYPADVQRNLFDIAGGCLRNIARGEALSI